MANLIQQAPPSGMQWTGIQDNWNAMKEDKAATLFFPFGDEHFRTMTALRSGIGQTQEIHQPRWSWFERERMEVPFVVSSVSGPTSGAYTVTMTSASVDPTTGYSWPAPQDIWQHMQSGRNFVVTSKPAQNQLVLEPVESGSVSPAITATDTFFYVGNTSIENSDGPLAKYYFSTEYTVGTQNVRHAKESSGNALFNQMWTTQTQAGVQTPYSNSLDVQDLQRQHIVAFINQFFTNQASNNLETSQSFNSTSSTTGLFDGLLPTINARGQKENTGGNPDETDLYALDAKFSQQDASIRNYAIWTSGYTFAKLQQNMLDYLKDTNINTTNQELAEIFYDGNMSTEAMRTTLDFKGLTLNGKNFALTRMGVLDNPQTFNAISDPALNPWQNFAFLIPMGTGANDGNGNLGKYVRILHKPQRFFKMWYTGAMSPNGNQTRTDELVIDILSEYSLAFLMANNFGLLYNSSLPIV